ncbi:MAG TPA: hypothetical protein VLV83_27190 [Acidobacteriota bacterium]|nr:hypothetical protein [Acidobacteriota bacterium]
MLVLAPLLAASALRPLSAGDEDRIYAKVTLREGAVLEGFMRWGGTETAWVDLFNGNKEIPEEHLRQYEELVPEAERKEDRPVYFLGFRLDDDDNDSNRRASQVRFGQIRSIEALNRNDARLTLRSGRQIVYRGGSNDIGRSLSSTVIEDSQKGDVKLRWHQIERVDFQAPPQGALSKAGSRLYGTLTTDRGQEFTGYILWDRDEALTSEELDGEQDGRDYSLKFGDIASIGKHNSWSSKVTLKSGEELILTGTNDVDDDNRGIYVEVPEWGEVLVPWERFQKLVLTRPDKPAGYDAFAAAKGLRGTVEDEDGTRHTGNIRWDNDESFTWETLEGENDDIGYSLLFSAIQSIEKTRAGCLVQMRGGPSMELEDSTDVNDENHGIFVETDEGKRVLITWKNFARATFE